MKDMGKGILASLQVAQTSLQLTIARNDLESLILLPPPEFWDHRHEVPPRPRGSLWGV